MVTAYCSSSLNNSLVISVIGAKKRTSKLKTTEENKKEIFSVFKMQVILPS